MGNKGLRSVLAVMAFVMTVQWARVARADTFNGTVGEIGTINAGNNVGNVIRFKLTNANLTAACADASFNGFLTAYAYFYPNENGNGNETFAKEWYAMLLYSKKGAPINFTTTSAANGCHVTAMSLP